MRAFKILSPLSCGGKVPSTRQQLAWVEKGSRGNHCPPGVGWGGPPFPAGAHGPSFCVWQALGFEGLIMLADSQESSRSRRLVRNPACQATFVAHRPSVSFLLLLWDVQGRHRKVSASQLLFLAPRRGAFAPGFPAHVPGPGNFPRQLLTHEPRGPRCRRRLSPASPRPPPQLRSREPGCWIPSLRLVLHFHKRAALRRAEIAAAASPRSAPPRRAPPRPHQSARRLLSPAGARSEKSQRGGGGGRLRAVLRGGGRGGERGWGGGRGAGTPLAAARGFAFLQSSDAGAASLACCRGSPAGGAR